MPEASHILTHLSLRALNEILSYSHFTDREAEDKEGHPGFLTLDPEPHP